MNENTNKYKVYYQEIIKEEDGFLYVLLYTGMIPINKNYVEVCDGYLLIDNGYEIYK